MLGMMSITYVGIYKPMNSYISTIGFICMHKLINQNSSLIEFKVDFTFVSGEYCRAHIEGDSNGDVRLSLLDAAIVPKSRDCLYDGVVVYDGNTTSGTMHGE